MIKTYVSAVAWASRGHARRMPKDHEPTPAEIEQARQEVHAEYPQQTHLEPSQQDQQQDYENVNEDEYPDEIEELSDEQFDNFIIKPTDALIAAAKVEEQFSTVQIYIYEQEKNNLYVHHEMQLSAFPLALQWVGYKGGQKSNLLLVSTFLPEIELWDLDTLN